MNRECIERKINGVLLCFISGILFFACGPDQEKVAQSLKNPEFIHESVKSLTDVVVHDIFSPPVASRVYVYPAIAAYEAYIPDHPEMKSLAGQLKGLESVPSPQSDDINFELASAQAFHKVSLALVFSEDMFLESQSKVFESFGANDLSSNVRKASIAYGEQVAEHILAWADKDNYKQTRTFPKYTVTDEIGRWIPTPPAYLEGIEPNWSQIRTFVLDSAEQYVPQRPSEFSMKESSQFYQEVMEVYETSQNLTDEQIEIAQFWDCNPYVTHHSGHVTFATKKITPGGHWIGIAAITSRTAEADFMRTLETYVWTSIALADGFISCWDEKYRSNLVRPETVINENIDEDWLPVLQTPPFPEYTSGHSVISTAAATALTSLYGESFHFNDTTELEYGLTERSFNTFFEASEEAAISRLYGGIHYGPAIWNGVDQGKKVGSFVVNNLSTRNPSVSDAH